MKTQLGLSDPDGFYEYWLDAHIGLDEKQSFELNARLVMLLANQIGDQSVIEQCIDAAKVTDMKPNAVDVQPSK
jgi:Protein of unknown function (DUF2783)